MDIFDSLENFRTKAEDVLRKKQDEITVQNETGIIEYSSDGTVDKQSVISTDKALSLLARIKDSYEQGHMESAEYEKMVLGIIQDYLIQFEGRQKVNFVINAIVDSEFMSYLSKSMLNKLRLSTIESVSNNLRLV